MRTRRWVVTVPESVAEFWLTPLAGLAKIVRDREVAEERKLSDEQQRLTEAEAIDRERALVAHSIGAGLAKLAAQDVAYRMNDDLPEAYRALQEDFNTAMQQLFQAALQPVAHLSQ